MTRVKNCKGCGAPIIWVKTKAGKAMPCDLDTVYYCKVPGGKERVITPNGEVIACEICKTNRGATGVAYVPHWATCKSPAAYRKGAVR